jgi:hypothetical protein
MISDNSEVCGLVKTGSGVSILTKYINNEVMDLSKSDILYSGVALMMCIRIILTLV